MIYGELPEDVLFLHNFIYTSCRDKLRKPAESADVELSHNFSLMSVQHQTFHKEMIQTDFFHVFSDLQTVCMNIIVYYSFLLYLCT